MNKITLIGNLTRDPELFQTKSGVPVCKFTIAVNRPYESKNGETETDFFNCTAWRGHADSVSKYCKKGNKVAVAGSIQIRQYEGNDGVKRNAVDVIVQEVEFLSKSAQMNESEYESDYPQTRSNSNPRQQRMNVYNDVGDIPF